MVTVTYLKETLKPLYLDAQATTPLDPRVSVLAYGTYTLYACCSVADRDPGSGALLTPGSGMGKKLRSEVFGLKIRKFLNADPGSF
jgi:hypothetical protein